MGIAGGLGGGRILFSLFWRASDKMKMIMIGGVIAAMVFFGFTLLSLLGMGGSGLFGSSGQTEQAETAPAADDEYGDFLNVMTSINQRFWEGMLTKYNIRFKPAKMVIYSVGTQMDDGSYRRCSHGTILSTYRRAYLY